MPDTGGEQTRPIPFIPKEQPTSEPLAGGSPLAMNVALGPRGTLKRRPGIQELPEAGSSVVDARGIGGVFATSAGKLFAVSNGPLPTIYHVAGGSPGLGIGGGTLTGARRPVFAETEALVVIADGGTPAKVDLATLATAGLGGSPPLASHVIFNSSRLLANDVNLDRSKVNYSAPAGSTVITGHETWGGAGSSGFFSGEARPDAVVALHESTNEVFVFGTTSLEIYVPDPGSAFARGVAHEYGCSAPYSIVKYDGTFMWIDSRRRVVQSDGRSVQSLSSEIEGFLDGASIANAYGYRVDEGTSDLVVWRLNDRTLCYQVGLGWSQWAGSGQGGQWTQFPVTAHTHNPITGEHVVGLSDGRIGKLVDGAADDLGEPIEAFVETGSIDHGSRRTKLNASLRLTLERGSTTSDTEPVAFVQYADAPGRWSRRIPIGLGRGGDTRPVVTLRSLGAYRTRAWRFIYGATENLALVSAEETFTWGSD